MPQNRTTTVTLSRRAAVPLYVPGHRACSRMQLGGLTDTCFVSGWTSLARQGGTLSSPSTWEAKAAGSLRSKTTWSTELVPE